MLATTLMEYAGFWLRLLALLVDGVSVALLSLSIWLIAVFIWGPDAFLGGGFWTSAGTLGILGLVTSGGVGPVYCWLFTGFREQTPGKIALGIRVTRRDGGRPGLWRTAVRELLVKLGLFFLLLVPPLYFAVIVWYGLSFGKYQGHVPVALWLILIPSPVGLAGLLWVTWDPHKQGWHDKLAGTYVVRNPKGTTR